MRTIKNNLTAVAIILAFVLGFTGAATAQRNDKDIRDSLRNVQSRLDDFEMNLRYQMQSSSASNRNYDNAADLIRELRNELRHFQDSFDRKRESRDDVNAVVEAARRIDDFLRNYPQNRRVTDDWTAARKQVDRLANNYGVMPRWDNINNGPTYPNPTNTTNTSPVTSVGISGTYSVDRGRSENVDEIVSDARVGSNNRDDLKGKLEAPEQIAIEVRGNQVTLATSNSAPVTFTADGRDKTESDASGRSVRTRATLGGETLIVSSLGGDTDYTITFTSVSGGQGMKVSRRITTDYLRQTVFAESIYNKTDVVARLGIDNGGNMGGNAGGNTTSSPDPNGTYSDNDNTPRVNNGGGNTNGSNGNNRGNTNPNGGYGNNRGNGGYGNIGRPSAVTTKPGNYTVPNGIVLTGTLENEINTKVSQNNDRFRLTVQTPDEFRGAVIDGYVSNLQNSGRVTGRATITLNFERIRLSNGQTYDFAGTLQDVRDSTGKYVEVDNEGTILGNNQTNQTAKRGGVGAGIGAVIGAIAGGGKGAVLGAIIGSGAGTGSVIAQGKDDLRLLQGTSITVQSSSPMNVGPR